MKNLINLTLLLFITFCNGQENNFIIGSYMFVPDQKEIRKYTEIGGVNWDGYEYRKATEINYDTTTLLIVGDRVLLKEDFPFNFNLNTLKLIYKNKYAIVLRDDKNIYHILYGTDPLK